MLRNHQRFIGLLLPIFLLAVPYTTSSGRAAADAATRTTTIVTGAAADFVLISHRFHELIVDADFDAGGGGIILVDQRTNRVIARTRIGDRHLASLTLDETHGRLYGYEHRYVYNVGSEDTLVGIDLATGHVVLRYSFPNSYVVDPVSGQIFLSDVTQVNANTEMRGHFAGYTATGRRIFSTTFNLNTFLGTTTIRCVDGIHRRAILEANQYGGSRENISARDTRTGRLLWEVPLAYIPVVIACDSATAQVIIGQPSGDISLLDTRTHRFGPRLPVPAGNAGTMTDPFGPQPQRFFLSPTTHTGLYFWEAINAGDGIDFIDLNRHVRRTLLYVTSTNPCGTLQGTGPGLDLTGATVKVLSVDDSRGVVSLLYRPAIAGSSNNGPGVGVAAINMRTGRVVAKVAVPVSDVCSILAGDTQRVYVAESKTATDPNTQQQTTTNWLVAIQPTGKGP